jgi:hypothetical protein
MPKVNKEPKEVAKSEEVSHLTVTVEKGFTVNIGNHNFAKTTISVQLPYLPTGPIMEAAKITVEKGLSMVEKLLDEEVDKLGL